MELGEVDTVGLGLDCHHVAESDPEVVPDASVHADLSFWEIIVLDDDGWALLPLVASEDDSISMEDPELIHFLGVHLNGGVVIILGFFSYELVWCLFLLENGGGEVCDLARLLSELG